MKWLPKERPHPSVLQSPSSFLRQDRIILVNRSELTRANWLWARRPRYVLFDGPKMLWGRLLLASVIVLLLALCDVPGLLAAALFSCAIAITITADFYARVCWRRDYASALARLRTPP